MTPELKAKEWLVGEFKRDLFKYVLVRNEDRATVMLKESAIVDLLATYAASQLSTERKWWIERIEQERDAAHEFVASINHPHIDRQAVGMAQYLARKWDDLLTSVRERGGK